MDPRLEAIATEIEKFFTIAKEAIKGKLAFADAWALVRRATSTFVRLVEQLGESGPEKKDLVRDLVLQYYDEVIAPLDIPQIPNFMEPAVDSAVRVILDFALGKLIDSIVAGFNTLGWD